MSDKRYQLVALGPAVDQVWPDLESEFNNQIRDIGLDPGQDAEILRSSTMKRIDILWDSAPVAIWFGDLTKPPAAIDTELLEDFQIKRPNPVFPVCDTLVDYPKKVPPSLRHINGQAWEPAPVVANVLKAFNLVREERQVFISYRRSDSQAVAQQLYEALQHRKFRVFLDTASVDAGFVFQDVLHGRLSDVDLVVFLDTKNAFDSDWVYEELLQAEKQGFGILQLLWPERQRDKATQFCDLLPLKMTDFVSWSPTLSDDNPDPSDQLKDDAIETIVHEVERTRIRSIRNRRDQVLTEIVDTAQAGSLETNVSPTGSNDIPYPYVNFRRDDVEIGRAFPVVGFPNSILLHDRHDRLKLNKFDVVNACVVYDELGMTAQLRSHLEWLNQSLAIRTVPVTAISEWLKGLKP